MRKTEEMVREMHEAFGLKDNLSDEPTIPSAEVSLLRIQCLTEEVAELAHALGRGDLTEVLDALVDIQYFLDGTFVACGMDDIKMDAFLEVHRSNMTKLNSEGKPNRDKSGRVTKPEGWKPPRLQELLELRQSNGPRLC